MKVFLFVLKIAGGGIIPILIRFEALWSLFNLTASAASNNQQEMEWTKIIELTTLFIIGAFVTYKFIAIERRIVLHKAVILSSVFKALPKGTASKGGGDLKSVADAWKSEELEKAKRDTKELLCILEPNLTSTEAEGLTSSFYDKLSQDFKKLSKS